MDSAKHKQAKLQALAEYQKARHLNIDAISKTIMDESDRGMVVIMGSLTEDLLLEQIIRRRFAPLSAELRKQISRSGGLLSTWADRTNLARALGLIDDDDAEMLEVMKAMRNACAHSRKHIDFSTPELREVLCLMLSERAAADVREVQSSQISRTAYILACSYIWGRIKGETKTGANARTQRILDNALAAALREEERQKALQQKPTAPPAKVKRPRPTSKAPQRRPRSSRP